MLCFLNCHLAAHMQYASQRVDEFEYILDTQTFDPKESSHILDHKSVYIKRTLSIEAIGIFCIHTVAASVFINGGAWHRLVI